MRIFEMGEEEFVLLVAVTIGGWTSETATTRTHSMTRIPLTKSGIMLRQWLKMQVLIFAFERVGRLRWFRPLLWSLHVPDPGLLRRYWKVIAIIPKSAKTFPCRRRRLWTTNDGFSVPEATRCLPEFVRELRGNGRDTGLREDLNEHRAVL